MIPVAHEKYLMNCHLFLRFLRWRVAAFCLSRPVPNGLNDNELACYLIKNDERNSAPANSRIFGSAPSLARRGYSTETWTNGTNLFAPVGARSPYWNNVQYCRHFAESWVQNERNSRKALA